MGHNVRSQATDAALSRQVACTDGLGVAALRRKIDEAPVVEVLDENPPKFDMSVVSAFLPIGTKLVNKKDLQK